MVTYLNGPKSFLHSFTPEDSHDIASCLKGEKAAGEVIGKLRCLKNVEYQTCDELHNEMFKGKDSNPDRKPWAVQHLLQGFFCHVTVDLGRLKSRPGDWLAQVGAWLTRKSFSANQMRHELGITQQLA